MGQNIDSTIETYPEHPQGSDALILNPGLVEPTFTREFTQALWPACALTAIPGLAQLAENVNFGWVIMSFAIPSKPFLHEIAHGVIPF